MANQTLRTNSTIVESWQGGYKLELTITSESNIDNWTLDFDLPSYNIRGAYGVDLVKNKNGSYSFSGQGGWRDLDKGETAKAIFIIDDYGQGAKIPEFELRDAQIFTQPKNTVVHQPSVTSKNSKVEEVADRVIDTNASITADWYGGYKLEVDITGGSKVKDWVVDFKLPSYSIRGAYGIDLV
ncbi:MAG: hypothetical protein AAGE96_24215, partial [Cyanobacteria bacterium P01_G01_bin.19]